jgi:2-haloacid dehalogenase
MTQTDALKREAKVLLFDQYGTIVDMQAGLTEVAAAFLAERKVDIDPGKFVVWWRRTHFENSMIDSLCARGHTPYREIGHRAVDIVLERAGVAHGSADVEFLVAQIEKLQPFPEVPAALEKLSHKYRLAILSNGDRDMLEAAKPYLGFTFDATISVQEAGAFKPDHRTYAKAAEILGVGPSSVLFVANHAFDCVGAKASGMRAAFIDRRGRPFGQTPHQPDLIVRDMGALADLMVD